MDWVLEWEKMNFFMAWLLGVLYMTRLHVIDILEE